MTERQAPIRVAIDARIPQGQWGGIQQVVEGLAIGFGGLGGEDEFVFIGYEDAAAWLDPLLTGSCRRIEVPRSHGRSRRRRAYDTVAFRAPWATRLIGSVGQRLGSFATPIAESDGTLEAIGADVVHFVTPQAFLTSVPSVYQIMDLLHVHIPEFFSPLHRQYRTTAYTAFAKRAAMVSTMAAWSRDDIAANMGIEPSRIAAVPLPPVVTPEGYPLARESITEGVAGRYVLYPAQTWPHKNHLALIEAAALLRDQGNPIQIVCTGRLTDHYAALRRRIEALDLGELVKFLDYVDQATLASLYAHASALVFPSRFEGWGIPIVEAFAWDLPVACSNIAVLDEVAVDAAIRFDPASPASIAEALNRVVADEPLRSTLRDAGRARLQGLTWDRTARTFRAIYRSVAGATLTDEDRQFLMPPTLPT